MVLLVSMRGNSLWRLIFTYLDPAGNTVLLRSGIEITRRHNDRGRWSLGRCKIQDLGVKSRNLKIVLISISKKLVNNNSLNLNKGKSDCEGVLNIWFRIDFFNFVSQFFLLSFGFDWEDLWIAQYNVWVHFKADRG